MPSLFSRSRTFSTPHKKIQQDNTDEFGRSSSRLGGAFTTSKKDKKKANLLAEQQQQVQYNDAVEAQYPDGTFLPLNLERPRGDGEATTPTKEHDYGYLCHERHVVLGLEQLERLVEVVANELETRGGITTPFIFNNTALDISSTAIKRLVQAFVATCEREDQLAEHRWLEEARFAGPHELGMCLRWGLARVIRSVGGQDVRGLVSWEHYNEWRDAEAALQYPVGHFQMFLPDLPPPLQFIIVRLLSLLARLIANSTSSGHTPPTLSPLFGPLFFGLGPPTLAFHHAYIHYLRASNAMEHMILAFIRWQDAPRSASNGTGSAAGLGVPIRLKEWIKGYPASLPFLQSPKAKPQPRKGSRTVRVLSVRRNVRMYSADLVKTGSTWGQRSTPSGIQGSFAHSREWERIAPATLKLPPRYSDAYKKKMNLSNSFHPETSPGAYAAASAVPVSTAPSLSSETSSSEYFGLANASTERSADKFRSLTDMKWGEFEDMGFGNTGTENKLQFDLTESARQERKSKRQTLDWNDFSSAGFSRMDAPLSATLQFSTPVVNTVTAWPQQQAEIHRKLKKQQKALPSFGWDTEPVIGNEEVIEASFIDAFCDLVYGGGWMDLERGEALDRDCNWALVEFKCLSPSQSTVTGGSDPRTDTSLILFEEFVPLEYRQQLAIPAKARRRLPSLFSPSKPKGWKQAATLNGRPYVVGAVPRSPDFKEVEFDSMLSGTSGTKIISLSAKKDVGAKEAAARNQQHRAVTPTPPSQPILPIPPAPSRPAPTLTTTSAFYAPMGAVETTQHQQAESHQHQQQPQHDTPSKKSRFRLPVSPSVRRSVIPPAEYSTVEFQTRMASYSDDEHNASDGESEVAKQKRRESRSDAWVDILVEGSQSQSQSQAKRGAIDATRLSPEEDRRARIRRSDPDMASKEVAQVLASVGNNRSFSPPLGDRVDRDHGVDRRVFGSDVDEVDVVPRRSRRSEDNTTSESEGGHLAYDRSTQGGHDDEDDEEVIAPIVNARTMAKEQRRLGYFDLHPERRPVSQVVDDPRARFARDSISSDDGSEEQSQVPAPPQPQVVPPQPTPLRPLPVPPPVIAAPQPTLAAQRKVPEMTIATTNLIPPSPTTPNGNSKQGGDSSPARTPTGAAGSRTAALIEMYRERERTGSVPQTSNPVVIAPLNIPSRLPVRSASLPQQPGKDKDAALPSVPAPGSIHKSTSLPLPAVSASLSAPVLKPVGLPSSPSPRVAQAPAAAVPAPVTTPSPPKTTPSPPEPVLAVPLEDPGRVSPARYVHGAPLHNVMEEEEEE